MLRVLNSATLANEDVAGAVVIAGSYAGSYPAYLLAGLKARGIILHDAGFGRDRAGVAGLDDLEAWGVPGVAIDYRSARIGDGADMASRGMVSTVNPAAAALGCRIGQSCAQAAAHLEIGPPIDCMPPPYHECRTLLRDGETPVLGLDSISLVRPTDIGAVVISGSHGGLIGAPRTAVKVDVAAAVFHDAGIGCDEAGISRLPALNALGIAGAAVEGQSARIGDANSIWKYGRISAINVLSTAWGAQIGMSVQDFATLAQCGAAKILSHPEELLLGRLEGRTGRFAPTSKGQT